MAPPSPSARPSVVWIHERPVIVEVPVPVVSPRTPPEEFAAKQLRLRDALGMRLTDIVDRIVPASLHVLKTEPPHRTINEDGKPCWVRKIEGGPKYTVPRELVREPRAASVR